MKNIQGLPEIELGQSVKGEGTYKILEKHRSRGALIMGQPSTGKSALLCSMALQDMKAGVSVLVVDNHDNIHDLLPLIPKDRLEDVVVLSLYETDTPLWPVLNISRQADDALVIAGMLSEAWRAQYGEMAVGARAESVLAHTLLALPNHDVSPIELLAAISAKEYRDIQLGAKDLDGLDLPLDLFWKRTVMQVSERSFQDWAQSVANKLAPMVLHPWLRRAFCGTPVSHSLAGIHYKVFEEPSHIESVTWIGDGKLLVKLHSDIDPTLVEIVDHLDEHLIEYRGDDIITSKAFPNGYEVGIRLLKVDTEDPSLALPTDMEKSNIVVEQIKRRRRRRGWRRFADFQLQEWGIAAKETLDIDDLLDDGRIVLVELPEVHGTDVTKFAGTFILMAAFLRGLRQLWLPKAHRVPCSIYVDEAQLFLNASFERTLAELRKAGVGVTLSVQRLNQLGVSNSKLRQEVVDNVGAIITFAPGIEEVKEISELFRIPEEELRAVETGQGYAITLTDRGVRQKAFLARFPDLPEFEGEDPSRAIRQRSLARFYQSPETADAVFKSRAKEIFSGWARKPGPTDDIAKTMKKLQEQQ